MINNYYIYFNLKDNINYIFLLQLYRLAEYNKQSRRYDVIKYNTQKELAVMLGVSPQTLNNYFNNDEYNNYFFIDKQQRIIILNNNFSGNNKRPFIHLTASMVDFLLSVEAVNKNLFVKYFFYIKHFCSINNKQQDFTANQFFNYIGLSTKSTKYKNLLNDYNNILKTSNYVAIKSGRDNRGYNRNYYTFNYD